MSKRTALNSDYKGLVETMHIPVELHERDGKTYASYGSAVPIHCCTPEQVEEMAAKTHHYCGIFTEQLLAPLGELAYVRLDDDTVEKVFINRSKRLLVLSSDGQLAQWRAAPSFESSNQLVAGTPIVSKDGALLSLVTARSGNHYAVSTFEGEGGYFETSEPWKVVSLPAGPIYGTHYFETREQLREYLASLPPAQVSQEQPPKPALVIASPPRLVLETQVGRQLAHHYLPSALTTDVLYI